MNRKHTQKLTILLILFFAGLQFIRADVIMTRVTGAVNWNSRTTWVKTLTGKVAYTSSSKAVVGTGTLFTTELTVGDVLMSSGGSVRGTVESISDNTHLNITVASGSTRAAASATAQVLPRNTDDVYIGNSSLTNAAVTITFNLSADTIKSLNFIASPTSNTLTHSGTNALVITGDVRINQPTANNKTLLWNINAGSASVGDSVTIFSTSATSSKISKIVLTSGALNIAGPLTFNSGGGVAANAVIDLSGGAAQLEVGGNIVASSGTLTPGTSSTVILDGSAAQAIPAAISTFYHLTLTKTSSTATPAAALTVNGNLTIGTTTSFNAGSFSHVLKGNLSNSGTLTASTSTFTLSGSALQSIGGASATTFNSLTLNNAAGFKLNKAINVGGTITLTSGVLATDSVNALTINSTGTLSGGSATAYVSGPMAMVIASAVLTSKTFQVGIGGAYRKLVLSVTHANATPVTYTFGSKAASAKKLNYTLPAGISYVSGNSYFTVYRSAVANLSSATMQIFYTASDYVSDQTNLRVLMDNGSGAWVSLGGTGTAAPAGSITTNSFASFGSKFTFANTATGVNPLPISLLNFEVIPHENYATANWMTENEKNNHHFNLERSADGVHFESVGTMEGAGNSFSEKQYQLNDEGFSEIKTKVVYYRLKQTDYNGNFTFSHLVAVKRKVEEVFIGPNPGNGNFYLKTSMAISNLAIMNASGVIINAISLENESNSNASFQTTTHIDLTAAPAGMYFVIGYMGNEKLFVNRVSKQ